MARHESGDQAVIMFAIGLGIGLVAGLTIGEGR